MNTMASNVQRLHTFVKQQIEHGIYAQDVGTNSSLILYIFCGGREREKHEKNCEEIE